MQAKQTPLIDMLDAIPADARLVVEHDRFHTSFHPVGKLSHEAAAELRRLHFELECANAAIHARDHLHALNAELMEALQWIGGHDISRTDPDVAGVMAHGFIYKARAALAKMEESK